MLVCQSVNTQLNTNLGEIGTFSVAKETKARPDDFEHPAVDLR